MTLTLKNVRREWTSPQAETQYNRLQEIIDNEARRRLTPAKNPSDRREILNRLADDTQFIRNEMTKLHDQFTTLIITPE